MTKKWWIYLIIILFLISLAGGLIYYRQRLKTKQQLTTSNQWPLESVGREEFYGMRCDFGQVHKHTYNQAPVLAGGWLSLVDISCLYLNSQGQLETIYLPYWVYQPEEELSLMAGYTFKPETKEAVLRLLNATNEDWFAGMAGKSLFGVAETGSKMVILTNWPDEQFNANETQGAAFETLETSNPPYTRENLAAFRQTGDSKYLPQISGKSYFWPVADYSF